MITIIDYDAGNMRSVEKAFVHLGCEVRITSDAQKILSAEKLVLPGVGSFRDAMERLESRGLVHCIQSMQD